MVRGTILILLATTIALGGCSRLKKDDGIRFDSQKFRVKAKRVSKEDRLTFFATAGPVSRSLEGSVEAAAYAGTKYCIEEYGTSLIKWIDGPEVEDPTRFIDNDTMVLKGQCRP